MSSLISRASARCGRGDREASPKERRARRRAGVAAGAGGDPSLADLIAVARPEVNTDADRAAYSLKALKEGSGLTNELASSGPPSGAMLVSFRASNACRAGNAGT